MKNRLTFQGVIFNQDKLKDLNKQKNQIELRGKWFIKPYFTRRYHK